MENIQVGAYPTRTNLLTAGVLTLGARVLLAIPFIPSGVGKIFDFDGTSRMMAGEGMPLVSLLLVGAIVIEIFGGLSVLLGSKARAGAILLVIFLVPATLIFHDFWNFAAAEQQAQSLHFFKNLGLVGGLLAVAGFGAGPVSLDAHRARPGVGGLT